MDNEKEFFAQMCEVTLAIEEIAVCEYNTEETLMLLETLRYHALKAWKLASEAI